MTIDRSRFPTADGEYTPRQRRIIDANLAQAEKGPYHGPFKNGAEIAAFMKRRPRSARLAKSKVSDSEKTAPSRSRL
jgi:hypothetical protein